MNIKSVLIAIGGNEDKGTRKKPLHIRDTQHEFLKSGILYRIISEIKDKNSPIEIITTASDYPELIGLRYVRSFRKLGYSNINLMHIRTQDEANDSTTLDRLAKAGCILFSGGDQFKLILAFKDTEFSRLLHQRYMEDDIVIAGTSAGAMAMPDKMINPGDKPAGNKQGEPIYEGLSLIHEAIIDTHFLVRGRFRRLAIAVANNPSHLGIGLEEDTGIIIREGHKIETIGSGLVTIIDGRNLQGLNATVDKEEHDIFIENLLVHVLVHGNHFTLKNRIFS